MEMNKSISIVSGVLGAVLAVLGMLSYGYEIPYIGDYMGEWWYMPVIIGIAMVLVAFAIYQRIKYAWLMGLGITIATVAVVAYQYTAGLAVDYISLIFSIVFGVLVLMTAEELGFIVTSPSTAMAKKMTENNRFFRKI